MIRRREVFMLQRGAAAARAGCASVHMNQWGLIRPPRCFLAWKPPAQTI